MSRPLVRAKIMEFDGISKEETQEFFDKWQDMADFVQVTGIHNWSGAIKDIKITDERSLVRYPCVIMWYSLVINWNGQATVCSVDWNTEIQVGNVNNDPIHRIWQSPELNLPDAPR